MSEELRDTCVYAHFRKSDGLMFYVGIGNSSRPYVGMPLRSEWWGRTVAKHGYTVEILGTGLTWSEACAVEVELIAAFRSEVGQQWARLTNLTDGGDGTKGYKFTEEQKQRKFTDEWRGGMRKLVQDPEWRCKHAYALRKLAESPEWRARQAEVNRKLAESPEWRRKNAEANRKLAESPEWREKMREVGRRNAASSEWRARQAEAAIRRAESPHYRQRTQMGNALRLASAPYTQLLPGIYPWLYVWPKDGKVYAKPVQTKAPPASTDEAK